MTKKIAAIIEARLTSTRLPGKVLLPAAGKSMLGHLVERLKQASSINELVLAIPKNEKNNPLVNFAHDYQINIFRGSEEDVLARIVGAAESVNADVVVLITADCPLIDYNLVEQAIAIYQNNQADYVNNSLVRSYPNGMDIQIFPIAVLQKAASEAINPLEREHVGMYVATRPAIFQHLNIIAPPELYWPQLGLTLDEQRDYELLKLIIEHFDQLSMPYFSCLDVVNLLHQKPEWVSINGMVPRKGFS